MNTGASVGTVAFVRRSPYSRHPLAPAFVLTLAVFAGVVVALFAADALGYACRRIKRTG